MNEWFLSLAFQTVTGFRWWYGVLFILLGICYQPRLKERLFDFAVSSQDSIWTPDGHHDGFSASCVSRGPSSNIFEITLSHDWHRDGTRVFVHTKSVSSPRRCPNNCAFVCGEISGRSMTVFGWVDGPSPSHVVLLRGATTAV